MNSRVEQNNVVDHDVHWFYNIFSETNSFSNPSQVTLLDSNPMRLCETYLSQKQGGKIGYLKFELLSSMLYHAGVHARNCSTDIHKPCYGCYDETGGLLTGAVAYKSGLSAQLSTVYRFHEGQGIPDKGCLELNTPKDVVITVPVEVAEECSGLALPWEWTVECEGVEESEGAFDPQAQSSVSSSGPVVRPFTDDWLGLPSADLLPPTKDGSFNSEGPAVVTPASLEKLFREREATATKDNEELLTEEVLQKREQSFQKKVKRTFERVQILETLVRNNAVPSQLRPSIYNVSTTTSPSTLSPRAGLTDAFLAAFSNSTPTAQYQRILSLAERYLKSSGILAFYSSHFQPLAELQIVLKQTANDERGLGVRWTHVKLHEFFTREWQVLPERTHPLMNASLPLAQGFVLVATLVRVDLDADGEDLKKRVRAAEVSGDGRVLERQSKVRRVRR